MRNDIWTTIFKQLNDNFLSHILFVLLFSLSPSLSLSIVVVQWEERKKRCHQSCLKLVVQISFLLLYITSFWITHVIWVGIDTTFMVENILIYFIDNSTC